MPPAPTTAPGRCPTSGKPNVMNLSVARYPAAVPAPRLLDITSDVPDAEWDRFVRTRRGRERLSPVGMARRLRGRVRPRDRLPRRPRIRRDCRHPAARRVPQPCVRQLRGVAAVRELRRRPRRGRRGGAGAGRPGRRARGGRPALARRAASHRPPDAAAAGAHAQGDDAPGARRPTRPRPGRASIGRSGTRCGRPRRAG